MNNQCRSTSKHWRARIAGMAGALLAQAAAAAIPGLKAQQGFTEADDVYSTPAGGEAVLATQGAFEPGWYRISAEYRTPGFAPDGKLAIDVRKADRSAALSTYEWFSATPDWTPMELFFRVSESTHAHVRFGNWNGKQADARVELRHVAITPFDFAAAGASDWLAAWSFDGGHVGHLPPNWAWHGGAGDIRNFSLVPNSGYKTGDYVLRLAGDDKPRDVRSRALPLPDDGELVFTLWARADAAAKLTMHVVQDGWGKRVEKRHAMSTAWQKYEAVWPVPTTRERDWFFLRLDVPAGEGPVEIADMRLEWRRAKPSEETADPHQAALARGWQGVPGANLLFNPDLELGGTGFFYDFSWPKKYEHYGNILKAKPVEFLVGQGVDGGTCAHVQGTSLRAYCFPVTVGQTYTVSADLKLPTGRTQASCRVWAFDSEWNCGLAAKVDDVGAEWKRYHWTFTWKPENIQKRGYVRFDSDSVLIDRIQVVEGTAAAYEPPPVMVGMVYDRWQYFMRGRDDAKARIKVVPGVRKAGAANVVVVAADAWGREVWRREFQAPLDKITEIPLDLPTDKLGVFHLDLKATIGGKLAGIGISRYAIIDPPFIQPRTPGQPGLAGICQESFGFPAWLCADHAAIQTDIGIRLNRLFASIPPDLPQPIPAEFIQQIKAICKPFNAAGIDVLPCVELIPHSADQGARNVDPAREEDLKAFGSHLKDYVSAFKDDVLYWEIFNEPNLWRMPSGPNAGKRTMGPEKYLEFQKVAFKTIKGIDPKLQVVCNALNNVDFDWIDAWMKAGAGKFMDAFSFHPYSEIDFFPQGVQLEKAMQGYAFKGPLVNSEKYFGANLFYDRQGYEETRRGYYLPYDGELKVAGWSIQHFVSSVGVGVPVCFFNPTGTISRRGPDQEIFLYDFFAAYNAAIRLTVPAGRGERIPLGPTATALLFANAPEGPLVALWATQINLEGALKIAGDFTAYDIMGNVVMPAARQQGVRVATDPSYVRFAAGTTPDDIRARLAAAELFGMGDPFKVDVSIGGGRRLDVRIASQRNQPLDGTVKIVKLPEGWKLPAARTFEKLEAAGTATVSFEIEGAAFEAMAEYPVSVVVESGEAFARADTVLRPVFASRAAARVQADGDLADWAGARWIALGADHLSKVFTPGLGQSGADDSTAKLAVSWMADAMAIAVVAEDDVHHTVEAPSLAWQGDSVQVYFDPRNDAMPEQRNVQDDIEYLLSLINGKAHVWLVKGAEGNYRGAANRVEGFEDVDAACAVVRKGRTTVYELVLPKKPSLPNISFAPDAALGFSVLINDNDGAGRKPGLTLSPKGTEPYGAPHLYRDLILE